MKNNWPCSTKDNCQPTPRYIHRLTVEKPGTTVDAAGQPDLTATWVAVGTIKANFVTKGGKESYVFKQTQADTTAVLMAPLTDLSRSLHKHTDWRLRRGTEVYEITYSDLINKTGKVVVIEVKEAV